MGCGGSKDEKPAVTAQQVVEPVQEPVTAQPIAPAAGQSGGHGGGGKKKHRKEFKFQINLSGKWQDYEKQEDGILKRAFLIGQDNCRFQLRGQRYEYNFRKMKQKNLGTGKERDIRPPPGFKAPKRPLLPKGSMVVIKVPKGSAGKCIEIDDPNNKGQKIKVNVPKGAKPGSKMAVPVPEKGETVDDVREKQKQHSSTGGKVLKGTAAVAGVGALAVGGVILGEHLSGGEVSDWAGDAIGDGAGDAVADATAWTEDAVKDAVDWIEGDATDWVEGAVEDFPDWIEGAGDDIADVAEDLGDWLEDAAEDVGDFVTDLF